MSNLRKLRRARRKREDRAATPRWVPWVAGLAAIVAVLVALGVALDVGPGTPTDETVEATVVDRLQPRGTGTATTGLLVRLPDGREIPVYAASFGDETVPEPGDTVILEVRESRLFHRRQFRFLRAVTPPAGESPGEAEPAGGAPGGNEGKTPAASPPTGPAPEGAPGR